MSQIIVFSMLISSLYALIAVGFTLIFGVARVLNLAHGAFLMVAAYSAYSLSMVLPLNIYLAFVMAVLITALFAMLIYKGIVRHAQGSVIATLIATLVLSLALEQLIRYADTLASLHPMLQWLKVAFGADVKILPPLLGGISFLLGTQVINNRVLAFGVSWLMIALLGLFVTRTKMGKAIMACAMDRAGAELLGIDSEKIYTVTWGISGALAGVAGVFLAAFVSMVPHMWIDPLIISFAIVVLGGLGSIRGSLLAAYVIGFIETLTQFFIGPNWVGVPSLIILILILVVRPQGFFGVKTS